MTEEKQMHEIGERIQGLREACDVCIEDMARELDVSVDTYKRWEETGEDVPISAIYHMARKFDVEFTEILTGTAAKLDSYQIVRRGGGKDVDRYPGYRFQDMAWRFTGKIMQPLVVMLDPSDEPAKMVSHSGQEFNFVIEGSIVVNWGDEEFVLNQWDSIYFNPEVPHGQRCHGSETAKFVTIIAE